MADNVKSNERYNTPIEGPSWETRNYAGVPEGTRLQMIESEKNNYDNKAKRFYAILGSDSLKHPKLNMGNTELDARIKALAEENPSEYYELIQLAKDIKASNTTDKTLLKNAQNVIYSAEAWTHDKGPFQPVKREWPQQKAIQNSEQAKQTLNTVGLSGSDALENMRNIMGWFDYELKLYNAIPDTAANQKAIQASYQRLNNYRNTYNKYLQLLNNNYFTKNPVFAYQFFEAYAASPLTPLKEGEQAALEQLKQYYYPKYAQQVAYDKTRAAAEVTEE